jgi:CRP-like cAMP-binding protein
MKENYHQKRIDVYLEKFKRYLHQKTSLSDEIINIFASEGKSKKYKKGEFFSKQSEISDKSAFICKGIFNVFCAQEHGKLFVVAFLKEDGFVQSRFDLSAPCNVTIQALCDTIVIEFQTKMLHNLYVQYPQLGNFIRCIVEKGIIVYASHMIQIGTKKAEDNYLQFQNDFHKYEECIPKHLIAAYLGITPTQLSRIRKKYPERGKRLRASRNKIASSQHLLMK